MRKTGLLLASWLLMLGFLLPGHVAAQESEADRAAGFTNLAVNKPARQSSTYYTSRIPPTTAARAVDGTIDGNFDAGSVSSTFGEYGAWWEVDLLQDSYIDRVTLVNRTDCCGERLNNAVVIVFDSNRNEVSRSQIGTAGLYNPVRLGLRGRYVRVQLPRNDYLSLSEVLVIGRAPSLVNSSMTNLAFNKPANQSSTFADAVASRAVDENNNGNFAAGSVSSTVSEQGAWWEVDLLQMSDIARVTLWNRTDCCSERLNDAVIVIYDANRREVARRQLGVGRAGFNAVDFGVRGQYVRVQHPRVGYISLAEVRVIGTAPAQVNSSMVNHALNMPARQSSTDFGGSADRAVDSRIDGNFHAGSVTHTRLEAQPWWEVDLQQERSIARVTLFNRTDCCGERLNNAVVVILDANRNEVVRRSLGVAGPINPVDFGTTRGRYVRVQLPRSDYLSLAEVRVIGPVP